jgi:diacylglycerol kinase
MTNFKKFLKSFVYASIGLVDGFSEISMKIHGVMTFLVIIFGFLLNLNIGEWIIVLILIAMVWSAELINTAVEELSNIVRDTQSLSYKATRKIRDLSAGSVLIVAIVAAIIGLIIFLPKLLILIKYLAS